MGAGAGRGGRWEAGEDVVTLGVEVVELLVALLALLAVDRLQGDALEVPAEDQLALDVPGDHGGALRPVAPLLVPGLQLGLVQHQQADEDEEATQDAGGVDALDGLVLFIEDSLLGREKLG